MPLHGASEPSSADLRTSGDLSRSTLQKGSAQVVSGYLSLFGKNSVLANYLLANRHYFDDPTSAGIAYSRLRQISKLVSSAGFDQLALKARGSPLLLDAIFLIAVRGNLKELVYSAGSSTRLELDQHGFKSEKILNLHDAHQVKEALDTTLTNRFLPNSQGLSNQLLFATGYSLNDFFERDDRVAIFSDDIASCLRTALLKRAATLHNAHRDYLAIQNLADSLKPVTSGDLSVELVSRNRGCLIGGALSGDCTAPGSLNSWTVGPWALTLENFELRFFHKSEFFCSYRKHCWIQSRQPWQSTPHDMDPCD